MNVLGISHVKEGGVKSCSNHVTNKIRQNRVADR